MASTECNNKGLVKLNQSNGISHILLNDSSRKNALSKDMLKCLIASLEKIKCDNKQKVLVIRGAGNVFCSGADLRWMKKGLNQTDKENRADAALFFQLFELLNNFPGPVIVWVEKYAIGGALGLLACADYVIAESNVKLSFSEVKLGLVPATIAPFVVNKIGLSQARVLMLSAQTFTAKKAKKLGLIHEILTAKAIPDRVDGLCSLFKANGSQAMASTKHLLNELGSPLNSHEIKELCLAKIAESRKSDEGQEGVKAFFEKRQPEWYK
ncbi:enoyl-CoA hydratase-related protein [Endozoicomonas euniceicola]|uniref:Enoyl-CoA hydratase-related protein n=1 Tax=Endozoicomonas euniceicola TaxID=1234143 RepID=A0ABY6GMZ5_9GAMM|nr:enoyl-CoA hydratase-related protein [Endozoicomonas euniceicola]UYM14076.1 enoyl-CoA hydratase-related protein [Endozoicomonas euniceicola]